MAAIHPLRWLLVISFVVALPVNIAAAAILREPLPAVGLVPLGLSASLSILILGLSKLDTSDSNKNRHDRATTFVAFTTDVLSIAGFLAVLILTWSPYKWHGWYINNGRIFLIAYATTPMIFSLFGHFYLALHMIFHIFDVRTRIAHYFNGKPAACPHCHEQIHSSHVPYFSFAREGYQPVGVREEDRFCDDAADALLDPANDTRDSHEVIKGKDKETEVV